MKTKRTKTGFDFRRWKVWTIAALLLAGGLRAPAQETNGFAAPDFASFRIISQRNIFNPNRNGPARNQRTRPVRRASDVFSLVGTMIYQKGSFAFFEGTSSDYQKVLEPGGTVAGYRVIEVTANSAKLEAAGKQVMMRVGTQMRREEGGSWYLAGGVDLPSTPTESVAASAESAPSATSETPPPAASPEANEVLRRLMQLREQESK